MAGGRSQLSGTCCSHALSAGVLSGVFVLILVHDLTLNPGDLLVGVHSHGANDLTSVFLRYRDTPRMSGPDSLVILGWDSYLGLGMPVHGNPQMGLFYPPNWITLLTAPENVISWILVAHLWFAGAGAWILARRLSLGLAAAAVASIVSSGAPYLIAHLAEGHVSQVYTVAWMPWILLAFERFLDSNGVKWRAVAVCFALSFFAGHVQEIYYLALLLTSVIVGSAWLRFRSGEQRIAGQLLVYWTLAGLVGGALVAVDLIPVLLNSQMTGRGGKLSMSIAGTGLTAAHIQQLVNPFALGGPERIDSPHGFYWSRLFHFGCVPLVLALLGIICQWHRPQVRRLFWLCVVAVVFAFGTATPLYPLCHRFVPGVGGFREPARILFFCSFAIAMLAAAGTETLVSALKNRFLRTAVGLVPAVLIGAELTRHSNQVVAVTDQTGLRKNSAVSKLLSGSSGDFRILAKQAVYSDLESSRDRVRRVRGYEPFVQIRFAWMVDALFDLPDDGLDFPGFRDVDLSTVNDSVADLLGIRYVISETAQAPRDGWQTVDEGDMPLPVHLNGEGDLRIQYHVYENESPLPRAFVIGAVKETKGTSISDSVDVLEQIDPRESVLLDRDVLDSVTRQPFTPCSVKSVSSDSIEVEVRISEPGYLVLTDLFSPGWTASVDDKPVPVIPAYLSFRAVPLPAGDHTVRFEYQCPGQREGILLSSLAVIGLCLSLAFASRRDGKESGDARDDAESVGESEAGADSP